MNRHPNTDKNRNEPQVELESQFIMRLPPEPSRVLKEALRNSLPLKDRLTIKLENDMRYGEVRLDHWLLHAKVVDLPTIVESLKTIDNKSFYKTADICQMLICKEEEDHTATDEESPVKQKKKDPNKVDKKFLWPHGITPPTKNVRRRRFRKTLKKKYVEAPEIEKEVKRLLRVDNDAVNVKWEVICEDEDTSKPSKVSSSGTVKTKRDSINGNTSQSLDVAEHDIFGEPVSDSEDDDEEANINVMELDENSRLSADSRVSDSNSMQAAYSERSSNNATTSSGLVTEFSKDMFHDTNGDTEAEKPQGESSPLKAPKLEQFHSEYIIPESPTSVSVSKDSRLATLHAELAELRQRRQQQEIEIANIENVKLRQRFQEILDNLLTQEIQKVQEIQDLEME
ncbi:PREDICTED: transcription initiation factor TFIID subunit 7 isoform X1 [Acromyrmex echinatior]|uniref:Transcription initiation factor TFIID subunit 7 n=1 Tax=Acromyrmex echinatior TaxID=103372 RepID=F4X6V4_ACREC|nr:PREDICTED: transcription initiation factor TFIID subunit 7 isoform X1 [Acromyrmex echinatior]EGI57886.1 Transcription initiation factor TFIID subunit 7 [Acromyrmex echinatior]